MKTTVALFLTITFNSLLLAQNNFSTVNLPLEEVLPITLNSYLATNSLFETSENEPIPLFLIDEGFRLKSCDASLDNDAAKSCTISGLTRVLQNNLNKNVLDKTEVTNITLHIKTITDTKGKVTYTSLYSSNPKMANNQLKQQIEVEVKKAIQTLPSVLPAKKDGALSPVKTTLTITL